MTRAEWQTRIINRMKKIEGSDIEIVFDPCDIEDDEVSEEELAKSDVSEVSFDDGSNDSVSDVDSVMGIDNARDRYDSEADDDYMNDLQDIFGIARSPVTILDAQFDDDESSKEEYEDDTLMIENSDPESDIFAAGVPGMEEDEEMLDIGLE